MLTGHKRNQIDAIWDVIYAGGIANPLQVIEQLTYLLFLKRLDEIQLKAESEAELLGTANDAPLFDDTQRDLRWHVLKHKDPATQFQIIRDRAFPFIKNIGGENSTLSRHMENAIFLWPNAGLLSRVVEMLDAIEMQDTDTKGDLYEYMLAKLSQGGQNGQFRTPRHIIGAMVEMTQPQTDDIICDPACGTAGFLVGASEWIKLNRRDAFLASDGRALAHFNGAMFHGMDFDSTMLRIAAMNMTLHGVENPNILALDALSGDNTQSELYTLILANPPFAGNLDKSGVAKDLTYAVNTSKTELLFVALFLRLLKPGGRAAVIVPDGVLFGASNAHKTLRQTLVETHKLDAMVSLPSGVFKPYAGVSTAILFFTKTGAGGTGDVWFFDVAADGYSLDDKRSPIEANDLPDMIGEWKRRNEVGERPRTGKHFLVPKSEIAANNYDLSLNRYKEVVYERIAHEKPAQILAQLNDLEADINAGLEELQEMLA